ncbi:hypothetical protein MASSI9I_20877 [Massilia sp. 9I]|nr:hypothetical protein MASSI9I_20877 [Massilia sp. 9I]
MNTIGHANLTVAAGAGFPGTPLPVRRSQRSQRARFRFYCVCAAVLRCWRSSCRSKRPRAAFSMCLLTEPA